MAGTPYAELHCHTNFSFLDGASDPDELVERAVELGLRGLAVTDHRGLYGVVRFVSSAEAAGLHPVIGIEIELRDPLVADPDGVVIPARRHRRRRGEVAEEPLVGDGRPIRPRAARPRLPGHREPVKEDLRGIGDRQRGPHLVLLARDTSGYRSLCRLVSRANLAGTKSMPRFSQALLAENAEGLVALSGGPDGEIGRRLRVGDREGARKVAEGYARRFGRFYLELQHHLLPDDDWLVAETAALAGELGLPVVVTNDVHYARPEGRELHDVLTAIRHGRTLDTLAELRRRDTESSLKSGDELAAMPPATDPAVAAAWAEGLANSVELAASCQVDLGFEQYRFPGFPVPNGETPFSYLSSLCWEGAQRRYHPLTSAVVNRLAHELDVIERAGLAEFFLICWDLMRFAKEQGIPAQGRGSATSSIVSYTLGISRVEPIQHNLLFERFINEGRTSYPDVDIDFSSERREEVIQYVYERYGEEHTGMVCNLVTYRARSAVREVGYALGFPRPLVDRVAKALETYDSVMVRRDLEADGGFAEFFRRPTETPPPVPTEARGLTDAMGQLRHVRGGRIATGGEDEHGDGRLPRREDAGREPLGDAVITRWSEPRDQSPQAPDPTGSEQRSTPEDAAATGFGTASAVSNGGNAHLAITGHDNRVEEEVGTQLLDGMGQLNTRVPLVGKVPPWRQPPKPVDPNAPRPFAWLRDTPVGADAGVADQIRTGRVADAPTPLPDHSSGPAHARNSDPTTGQAPPEPSSTHPVRNRRADPGTWDGAPDSPPSIRFGGREDDEGGPGDTPASVAWLRAGRGTGYGPPAVDGRRINPESGELEAPGRRTDRLGRPNHWDPPAPAPAAMGRGGGDRSSVARIEPEPPPQPRGGSTKDLSDWERWLEFCARIDGFPRHLSIHSGGMLVTAAPLIDIAPLERATMPGRVVAQYDKRDVETLKLIKLDLLGLGMLAAIDETIQLIEHDCGLCLDLDRLPEEIPEVFEMLQAADTVGVFQVESRAQMQTLPKSRPQSLDDLVVEVAIIRPGPIQGNAVHPYLRRKQGLEPVNYLHPSLEPVLRDSLGVILYQEQVMRIAIEVAGFTPAGSDAFRRAMGTWRSTKEMEKLHVEFVEGAIAKHQLPRDDAEELFRQCAAFASFGFAKSHAAAFARTAYESSFLKLFYPAQFLVGLINAQPMGFYPVEVLVNDAKRHGVTVLPIDVNASSYKTTTEWVGRPGWVLAGVAGDDGSHDGDEGEPLPDGCGVDAYATPVRSPACLIPNAAARDRWAAENAPGWGVRLGLSLVKGIGEQHEALLDAELARGPYAGLTDVVERTGLPEEVIERLIRVGALDSLGRPRRELLWQLREVAGTRTVKARATGKAAGRPVGLRLPATEAPPLPGLTETERLGDAYAVSGLDARRQAVSLFREALDRLGVIANADLATHRPGRIRIGGLVVTRQHPMTARGTVFLALEDETGMANVTLWPDTWARWRGAVRRHALLLIDGELQREGNVVNVIAHEVRSLVEVAHEAGGPVQPDGVRQLGHAGMRRLG